MVHDVQPVSNLTDEFHVPGHFPDLTLILTKSRQQSMSFLKRPADPGRYPGENRLTRRDPADPIVRFPQRVPPRYNRTKVQQR